MENNTNKPITDPNLEVRKPPNEVDDGVIENSDTASPQITQPTVLMAPSQAPDSLKTIEKLNDKKFIKRSVIVVSIFILLLLTDLFVIQPTTVNGISMQPTLYTNNILLVWKWPQTWAKITGSQYIPKRGQVVIVKSPDATHEQFVKRVIGVPGDHVVIANETVTVFNDLNNGGFNPDKAPYGAKLLPTDGSYNTNVYTGTIFVMGDNRTPGASIDSRSSMGNIPASNIIGQAVIRVFPFNKITIF